VKIVLMTKTLSMTKKLALLLALIAIISAVIIFSLSLYFNQKMHQSVSHIGQQQIESAVSAQLIRDVTILSATLTDNLSEPLYNDDFTAIKLVIDELARSGELAYVYVFDIDNNIVHDGSVDINNYGQNLSHISQVKLIPSGQLEIKKIGRVIHLMEPIKITDSVFGGITFGIKFKKAEQDIAAYSDEIHLASDSYYRELWVSMLWALGWLILLILPIALILAKQLLAPLQQLAKKSQAIKHHHADISFALDRNDEIGQLASALQEMTTRLSESHHEVIKIAFIDELTSLSNRRYFNVNLPKLIKWSDQYQFSFAIIFIDLDHFKQVNDDLGHDVGDALLIAVAKTMQQVTNAFCHQHHMLIDEKVIVARLGGDEFVVVVPLGNDQCNITELSDQLLDTFSAPFNLKNHEVKASLSMGITLYPDHGTTINELLKNSDLAMYDAKNRGRGCASMFNQAMKDEFQLNHVIKLEVELALSNGQISLEYQPYYNLDSNFLIGACALVRWQHPQYGLIPAELLNEVLEDSRAICALSAWVLKQVCCDSLLLDQKGIDCLFSVNISNESLTEPDCANDILLLLNEHYRASQSICLQLNDTVLATDIDYCATILNQWKNAGAQIWIDRLSLGYSSLHYVEKLPIDAFVIDKTFIYSLTKTQPSPVIKSIYALAQSMAITVIAQDITTAMQAQHCRELGSITGQGMLYSGALSIEQLIAQMESAQYANKNK